MPYGLLLVLPRAREEMIVPEKGSPEGAERPQETFALYLIQSAQTKKPMHTHYVHA